MTQRIHFDYSELEKKYKEVFGSQEAFAAELGIDRTSLIKRLANDIPFKANEIKMAAVLLGISSAEINRYFFTEKVEKTQGEAQETA